MTNYNDGKWHGWNGGECPVHPNSRVSAIEDSGARWTAEAGDCDWSSMHGAFRVTVEYREPRECWSFCGKLHDTLSDAEKFRSSLNRASPGSDFLDCPITKWVEVLP